jgi:hypothetical protein
MERTIRLEIFPVAGSDSSRGSMVTIDPHSVLNKMIAAVYARDFKKLNYLARDDFNRGNEDAMSPMAAACYRNYMDVARFLLDHGADPNWLDNAGRNMLFYANSKEMIRLFIERGARLDFVDQYGSTACDVASHSSWRFLEFMRLGQKPTRPIFIHDTEDSKRFNRIQSILPTLMILCKHYSTDLISHLKLFFY